MRLPSWRPALLVAWRQARRQRLRSVAMILILALPVAGVSAFSVVYRSTHLSVAEQVSRALGGADAVLDWFGTPLLQAPNPAAGATTAQNPPLQNAALPPAAAPLGLLPAGAVVVPEADANPTLVSSQGTAGVMLRGVDLRSPGPGAGVRVRSGTVPTAGGQIALSPSAAGQLRAGIGATVGMPGTSLSLKVVGIVADRFHPDETVAFTTTSTALRLQDGSAPFLNGITRWYVEAKSGVTWTAVMALNRQGWQVTSRAVIDHLPPGSQVPYFRPGAGGAGRLSPAQDSGVPTPANHRTAQVGAGILVVLLVLEVVLLCGPAFAIGARRRRQQLGVVAAGAGAPPSQLRWFVVADGLLLGLVAALAGAAAGIGIGAAVLAVHGWWAHQVPGPLTIRGWEITAIAALAVVSGLLSSLLPAWSASRHLTGRSTTRQPRWRWTWPLGAAGLVLLVIAVVLGATRINEASSSGVPVPLVLAAALAEIGLVCLTPAMLTVAGLAARRLPLWPRIALRETARSRSATAAAAAIIAVVAAASASLVYASSVAAHDRVSWLPSTPVGDATAFLFSNPGTKIDASAAYQAVRTGLPGSTVLLLDGQTNSTGTVIAVPPGCTVSSIDDQSGAISYAINGGDDCDSQIQNGISPYLIDAGPGAAAMIGGLAGQQAEAALQAGKAVVFDPRLVAPDGKLTLAYGSGRPTMKAVGAVAVNSGLAIPIAPAIFPPRLATTLQLDSGPYLIYVKAAAAQPASKLQAVDLALTKLGIDGGLYVQGPYTNGIAPILWAVTGAAVLLIVAATVAAAALLGADAIEDQLALFAVGADPRGRRRLAMSRAAVICAVGSVFGAAAGLLPGAALVWRLRQQNLVDTQMNANPIESFAYPLSFPWTHLVVLVVAAPLLAALATAVLSRRPRPVRSLAGGVLVARNPG